VIIDLHIFFPAEFEAPFQVAVRFAKGRLARLAKLFLRIDLLNVSFLKLDIVAASSSGYINKPFR